MRCAVLCLVFPVALFAQRTVTPRDSAARADSARAIAPVVVTVLRAPLALSRAPFAISATPPGDAKQARPGLAMDEALRAIPGVQVDNRYNYALGERISVRGFGGRAQFGVRGVRVLVDGIPATLPDGQTNLNAVDIGSLGRAEVMRGPAAALYGNASGGVIQLESEAPSGLSNEERIKTTAGQNGMLRLQGIVSGTMVPATYLVSAARLRYDGYRDWNSATSTYANSRITYSGASDELKLVLNGLDYSARNPGGLTAAELVANRNQAVANNIVRKTGKSGTQGQGGITWKHALGLMDLDVSAHALTSTIDNPIATAIIALDRAAGGVRAALSSQRSSHNAATIGWSAGAEAEFQRDGRLNFVNDSGRRAAITLDQKERVRALSPFAESWAVVGDRVTVLAGARYDQHTFTAEDHFITPTNADDSGDRGMSAWSPSLGVSVRAAPGLWLYSNYATAFDTPSTTELTNRPTGAGGFNPDLEPQRTRSVEVGANLSSGRLRAQAAVYRAHVVNALIPFEVPSAPGRQYFRNAGSAFHRGFESSLSSSLGIADGRIAYTYTGARFEHYSVTTGTNTAVYDGQHLPGVSPHRFDGTVSLHPTRQAFVALDGRYSSATPVDDANLFASPGYALFDLRAGSNVRGNGLGFAPFIGVSNLVNRQYNTSVVVNAALRRYFEPGPGRTLYGGAEIAFGARGRSR